MALELVVRDQTMEKPKDVQFFTSKTALIDVDTLEAMFKATLEKFQLKQVFHNMRGMHELNYDMTDSYSRKTISVKEEGLARLFANGRTMVAMHSYEVKEKVLKEQRLYCPLVYVVGFDKRETEEIAVDVRAGLLRALCKSYMEADTRERREKVAMDIADNVPGTFYSTIEQDLDKLIDEELRLLEQQLVGRVLSYEKGSTKSGQAAS